MSLIAEAPEFLQVYSDGKVKRFNPEIAPPSLEPTNGYKSKDIIIDPSKSITARLFIPQISAHSSHHKNLLLPVLVYFHGGGFCIGSTTWLGYHNFLGDFSVTSQSIILSVDYRLAPEYRLPIPYEDCYTSLEWLEWLEKYLNIEPFLQQADLSNVFLSGDSAGGNIAHYVTLKALQNHNNNDNYIVKIKGLMLIHPYFGSEERTEKEKSDEGEDVVMNDMFWRLSIPEDSNRDYFGCNFEKAEVDSYVWSEFPAVEIYVAERDFLKERGVMYAEFLKRKGVKDVKLVEAEKEKHIYHVFEPQSDATRLLQRQMSQFMKRYN